jgi:hypothetical protein
MKRTGHCEAPQGAAAISWPQHPDIEIALLLLATPAKAGRRGGAGLVSP